MENDPKPKKKAKATKSGSPKLSNTVQWLKRGLQSKALNIPLNFLIFHLLHLLKIVGPEEVPTIGDEPRPRDRSVTITILAAVTYKEGVRCITDGIRALI